MRHITSSRFSAWNVFRVVSLIVVMSLDPVAGSGATWQTTPSPTLVAFVGGNLSLTYEYSSPHHTDLACRVSIGHYDGGSIEDLLVRGDFDPRTGHVEVKELNTRRLNVTSYPGGFTIHVTNLSLSDSGQYLVDIRFSVYDYLHHAAVLTVYSRPHFMTTPNPTDVVMEQGSKVTMSWTLSDLPSQPPIDRLQIKHTVQDVKYTLVDQRKLPDGRWAITYPDEQLRFKGRISYAPGPNMESIDLNIMWLELDDSGIYNVEIVFENDIIKLHDSLNLQVPPDIGIHWISVPSDPTYILESSQRKLNFTADFGNNKGIFPKYELSKISSGGDRKLLASMVMNHDNTPEKTESIGNPQWPFSYNSLSSSVLVTISNIQIHDAGRYTFDILNGSEIILAHYPFTIVVLNGKSLRPVITDYILDEDAVSLKIQVNIFMLTPLITVYDGNENVTLVRASTNSLETRIQRSQKQVLVVVEYENEDFHHGIQHLVNVTAFFRTGKSRIHVTSTTEADTTSLYPTTPAEIHKRVPTRDVQFHVIVSLEIIIGCVIILLHLVCTFYLRRWLISHITGAKFETYSSVDLGDPSETYSSVDLGDPFEIDSSVDLTGQGERQTERTSGRTPTTYESGHDVTSSGYISLGRSTTQGGLSKNTSRATSINEAVLRVHCD